MTKKKCPIHPTYEAKGKPTSKKEGCICREIWDEAQDLVAVVEVKPGKTIYSSSMMPRYFEND